LLFTRHQTYLPLRPSCHLVVFPLSGEGVSSRSLRVDALTSPCTPRVTRSRTRNARENDASASTEVSKLVERGLPAVDVTYPTHTTISSPDKTLVTQVACSSNQKVCGGGGGIPVAPAPEPILGSLSFHLCTSPLLSSAVSSAAGRCVRSPDLHLLAPAPHTYRSLPPTSAGAMEKDKEMKEVAKVHRGTSGGTGAKAGAGAASAAVPALSGPPGPASVCPHAGASTSSATPATLNTFAGVEVTQVAASPRGRGSRDCRRPCRASILGG